MDRKQIIAIDGTVIAGALILLTLLSSVNPNALPGRGTAMILDITTGDLIPTITATIVVVFAFSAVAASIIEEIEVGRRLMVTGFVFLFFAILSITYLPFVFSAITHNEKIIS